MSRKCYILGLQFDYRLNWQVWAYQIGVLIKEICKIKEKDTTKHRKD